MSILIELKDLLVPGEELPSDEWGLRAVRSEQCVSYVAWNRRHLEALVIDPKLEDLDAYRSHARELGDYLWLAVIDSHTHADHISVAPQLAGELQAPLVMHQLSQNSRVDIRVSRSTALPSHSGPVRTVWTPGHTADSMTVFWGPFLFGGDTLLFGDTGRDDLPGGDAEAHYDSLVRIKAIAEPGMIVLPGHDHRGGRASSWRTQLQVNASLTQSREDFVREASAFDAPAPKLLKQSLKENLR